MSEFKNMKKENEKMKELLRGVYDVIEMSHLTDFKMVQYYVGNLYFKRSLGDRIFGFLQSKDQTFRDKVIKRQNKWRKKNKPALPIKLSSANSHPK